MKNSKTFGVLWGLMGIWKIHHPNARRFSSESQDTKTNRTTQAGDRPSLDKSDNRGCDRPMMTASNIHYEIAGRTRATAAGGIGAMHLLVRKLGLD